MPAAELSRVLYRSLLRWAKEAEGVPFTLRPHDVLQINNKLRSFSVVEWEDSAAVRHAVRSTFRSNRDLKVRLNRTCAAQSTYLSPVVDHTTARVQRRCKQTSNGAQQSCTGVHRRKGRSRTP